MFCLNKISSPQNKNDAATGNNLDNGVNYALCRGHWAELCWKDHCLDQRSQLQPEFSPFAFAAGTGFAAAALALVDLLDALRSCSSVTTSIVHISLGF